MHVLLHPILPSYNWPSSPPRIIRFTRLYFLHKLFTILSFNMTKPAQSISFHSFHYTTPLHLHKVLCHHTFHTHFHCSHPPILSHHILLSDNFSTPHTLVCCVLFHVQVCDPYFSVGRRILFLKPLFISMDIFPPLITFASDLMTHLPFTTLFCISPSIPLYFQILKLYHFIHSFCP